MQGFFIVLGIVVVLLVIYGYFFGKSEVQPVPVKPVAPAKPAVVTPPVTVSVAKKVKKVAVKKTK